MSIGTQAEVFAVEIYGDWTIEYTKTRVSVVATCTHPDYRNLYMQGRGMVDTRRRTQHMIDRVTDRWRIPQELPY